MSLSIELESVAKHFGEIQAVRRIKDQIGPHSKIALIGHNGAGKTTLVNMIATLSRPSDGKIHYLLDGKPLKKRLEIRNRLALLSHESMLYADLTVLENFIFFSRLYKKSWDKNRIVDHLSEVGMGQFTNRLVSACSRGMVQRLCFARTRIHAPDLYILDEPFSGLDIGGVDRMKSLLQKHSGNMLIVSHDIQHCYDLADEFWIFKRGKRLHKLHKSETSQKALEEHFRASLPREL